MNSDSKPIEKTIKRRRVVLVASLVAILLATSGFLVLAQSPSQDQRTVRVLMGTPNIFGCGLEDYESGTYLTECVNASVTSVSGKSFELVLFASFANSTTGTVVGSGFKSQSCNATAAASPCLILVSLEAAGNYNMTISAVASDGKAIPVSPAEWGVIYGVSLESEGMG